jgi:hypothetical protein
MNSRAPNAFTTNNDGRNDLLRAKPVGIRRLYTKTNDLLTKMAIRKRMAISSFLAGQLKGHFLLQSFFCSCFFSIFFSCCCFFEFVLILPNPTAAMVANNTPPKINFFITEKFHI